MHEEKRDKSIREAFAKVKEDINNLRNCVSLINSDISCIKEGIGQIRKDLEGLDSRKYDFLIVGAGFSGAVLAERLASIGKKVLIIDKRNHIGGNCYDYLDEETGIMIQKYGPHIFHTKNKDIFEYLRKFGEFTNYKHKVLANYKNKFYPIPINLDTVNLFYNLNLKNEEELKSFLDGKREKIAEIKNSEDVVISKFGRKIYEAFVKFYTKKQWDKYPSQLDRSVLERLPIKYDRDPYYFPGQDQGMPIGGFKSFIAKMLSDKNITVKLSTGFSEIKNNIFYDFLVYTGPIDEFFNYKFGKIKYRSINFVFERYDTESYQPNSVVNYPEAKIKFSRVTEFKKFYDFKSNKTILCRELFSWSGDPMYPVFDKKNKDLIEKYLAEARTLDKVFFAGRLGTGKYLDIDSAVSSALELFKKLKEIK